MTKCCLSIESTNLDFHDPDQGPGCRKSDDTPHSHFLASIGTTQETISHLVDEAAEIQTLLAKIFSTYLIRQ